MCSCRHTSPLAQHHSGYLSEFSCYYLSSSPIDAIVFSCYWTDARPPVSSAVKEPSSWLPPMTTDQVFKILAADAEDARFRTWDQSRTIRWRFVYLCEYGTIWRFGPKEWWQFVTGTVRNNGAYDLPLSSALRSRPRHISKGDDRKYYSSDNAVRCVSALEWTTDDWKNELF